LIHGHLQTYVAVGFFLFEIPTSLSSTPLLLGLEEDLLGVKTPFSLPTLLSLPLPPPPLLATELHELGCVGEGECVGVGGGFVLGE